MRSLLFSLYTTSWLSWFAAQMLGPIYAIFVQDIGGDILDVGIAWAIFTISMGILMIIFGKLEDTSFDKRNAVVFGFLLITMGTAGYLLIETPIHLFTVQAILGLGAAMAYPAWDALFMKSVSKKKESTAWAIQEGGIQIVAGIAAVAGSFIAMYYGFTVLFVSMMALQMAALLLSLHLFLPFKKT